jgi:bifunctional non-homologous end joining protein LigD
MRRAGAWIFPHTSSQPTADIISGHALTATHHPMLASSCREPFDHANWLFELKHDGFRAIAFIEDGHCRLISRNGCRFGDFSDLEDSIGQSLKGHTAALDGEIVCLDGNGRSVFKPLIERQAVPYYYAFDLLWFDGEGEGTGGVVHCLSEKRR